MKRREFVEKAGEEQRRWLVSQRRRTPAHRRKPARSTITVRSAVRWQLRQ